MNFKNKIRCRLTSRSVEALFLLLRTERCFSRCFLVVFVFVSVCSVCGGYQEQKFAMEPQDQTAIVGSRVTLPCRVERKSGQLQWTKDDFGLGLHRELSGYDRYRMIGSDEEGDYSLDIRDVTLDDDAKYQCQVSSGPQGEPPIRSRYAQLTVLVPPELPKILQGNFLSIHEGTKVTLECISVGGKPPAEITWVDGNAGVITQGVTYSVEPLSDGQRFTARSIMVFSPTETHNNQTYTCQAQNTADRAYRSDNIRIEVLYSPKIKILAQGKPIKESVKEGENVTIECEAHGNPANLTYKIFVDGVFVTSEKITMIRNVSRTHHGVPVKCEVSNEMGRSDQTDLLSVSYAPKFRHMPHEVEGEIDTSATLVCDVDSYPAPSYEWLHSDDHRNIKVGKTKNLTVTLDTSTTGRYICRATVAGYPTVEAEINLFIKGPPKILSNSTQHGMPGDTVKVECAVFAIPRIDSVVWYFDGKEIDSLHDQDFIFQEELLIGGIINSTLIIRESQSRHFGVYKCNVSNEYGSDALEIQLKQSKSFPLLLILFGIMAVTVLFAAIGLLVVICQRKQRKNKQTRTAKKPDVTVTSEELYKENDRNSNISDLKLELRQANGNCEVDYSNNGSDSTLCSNAKLGSGIPLAGTVPITAVNQNKVYQPYRYSNDYTDPAFADYKVNGYSNGYHTYVHYAHDYNPGTLRVQSPSHSSDKLTPNRSINGSLPRSSDSTSTVQFNPNAVSQSNSLQRTNGKRLEGNGDINTVGIAGPVEVNRIANGGIIPGVDVRYAATYGNPHLRSGGGLGYATQVNTAKPASTPAPPPYSSVRNSVILPSGTSSHSITSPTSLASPQCATSPITTSTVSADSNLPQVGVSNTQATPQSPGAHYILAPSNRNIGNSTVTKKGNSHQSPLATHV